MAAEVPGFVDAHCHLVREAAGVPHPYDRGEPASIAAWHRAVASAGSTPMDVPPPAGPGGDVTAAIGRGLERAAAVGLVEVTEAGMVELGHLDALRALRERGPLPLRVRVLLASRVADPARMTRLGDPWLEIVGVKFYADGWVGPRTCALAEPFSDDAGNRGLLFLDADALARRAAPFAEAGWTVATHAIGDRAVEAVLDAYEKVYGGGCRAAAPRIEHAQVIRPDLIERMVELGVVVCIQPSFAVSDAAAARPALGERMEHAYRWSELLAAGIRVISGSDFPVETLSPLAGLQHLVTGAPAGGDPVAETLPIEAALPLMTDASAGTTVLDADPRTVDPHRLAEVRVLATRPN